ncbi:accessory Sec system glycosylation chaperone GtfB [Streptococcus loxodontisalivarius]|uniref:UDP-N-acetylglucosamine--peptide N-acetylglucosaminyltransferase stabilizing protein GtfB n=1 Tax=Streptococcus loxodontisalivarius TaxID=1349415 RepID=A0ABS2PW18_9STRE|nr:accessory Sec system glycosylation chaperone GtfB [Streptococcus loxodontisalivarius]MBM7643492.1 accessory Sec system glycosyltransferase GtfB [Streptococcus loxodontisalivarius]
MIRLFDWLNQETLDLHFSLETSGLHGLTILLNDDGCLPEGVTSPYSYFCGMSAKDAKPRYFNQITIPDFWQITGNNVKGEIWNYSDKMADIYYHEPNHLRLVKTVDWLDKKGQVRLSEHYNQQGWVYAKTYLDENQNGIFKSYFTQDKQEVITENLKTGAILLNWNDQVYHFNKKLDFVIFYLKEAGLDLSQIWYNSLGMPFMISYYLDVAGQDILFWQEDIGNEIPGNMQVVLSGRTNREQRVVVQKKAAYDKLQGMLTDEQKEKVVYLGYLYPEMADNSEKREILILTNSDNIQSLDYLVSHLKDYRFHIGALTEMSQHLMSFASYDNVQLYPNISPNMVYQLLESCAIYLDINHGSEILTAVRKAFEYNLLIMAFDNTSHNRQLTRSDMIFSADNPASLVTQIYSILSLTQAVKEQRQMTGQESVENYQALLG